MLSKISLFLLLTILSACSGNIEENDADIILTNGRVYTMRWEAPRNDGTISDEAPIETDWTPDADAVVINGNKIGFVGSTPDALKLKGDKTRIIDLAGAVVIPGLVDSHTHVFGVGAAIERAVSYTHLTLPTIYSV